MTDFALPDATRLDKSAPRAPRRRPDVRGALDTLFPQSPVRPSAAAGRRLLGVVAQAAAVVLGTVLLLLRVPGLPSAPGLPSWQTIYGEDFWEYLTQALQQPWHLFIAYNGYEQLLPRVIAQFAAHVPLTDAAAVFAVSGALIAALCGLFVFYASAGHIRSTPLRALLGAAVVLLPIAPMEIADSAVNAPWYLQIALFWALLWRPRTRAGMAAAALVAFAAVSGNSLFILFAPLVAIRLYVLRSPREHAVTAGWLAGCLLQVPFIVSSYLSGQSRLGKQPAPLGHSLAFYAHDVILPALGWHLAWRLQSLAGKDGATVIVAVMLLAILGAIFATQARNRPFVVTAVVTGFAFPVIGTTLTGHLATAAVFPDNEGGSRYTALPIFLIESAVIIGVDWLLRSRGGAHRMPRPAPRTLPTALAVVALVAVLAGSWVADFRYAGIRSDADWNWPKVSATWLSACQHAQSGQITEWTGGKFQTLPCDRMRV